MIGTNLGLSLPLLSDNLATIVSKTSTALSAIQTSIADDATQAAINITGALSFGGNWATDVGGLVLTTGNAPSAAGSVYYSGGEFYMVDATSAIKMTLNGTINVAGVGGIGGDYGGSNPALVSYDTASSQYRFYINGGTLTFADIEAREYFATSNGNTIGVKAPAALAASYHVTLPAALPATTKELYIGSTGILQTGVGRTITIHGSAAQPSIELAGVATWNYNTSNALCWTTLGSATTTKIDIPVTLPAGSIITSYTLYIAKTTNGGTVLASQLGEFDATIGTFTANLTPGTGTETTAANNPGKTTLFKAGLTYTVQGSGGTSWLITFYSDTGGAGDVFYSAVVTYLSP